MRTVVSLALDLAYVRVDVEVALPGSEREIKNNAFIPRWRLWVWAD